MLFRRSLAVKKRTNSISVSFKGLLEFNGVTIAKLFGNLMVVLGVWYFLFFFLCNLELCFKSKKILNIIFSLLTKFDMLIFIFISDIFIKLVR